MKKLLALLMAVAVTFQLVTPVFADTEGTEETTAPTEAVVETKAGAHASRADRVLWALGHRPQPISKYATGLAALREDLPGNRWHRLLTAGVLADR